MQFHYTVISPYGTDETVHRLENALQNDGFSILWRFDVQDKLQEKGFTFTETLQVLEVCNLEETHRILSENMMAGYFLPCKIAIYTEREQVHVGMPKPTAFISTLDDNELKAFAESMERQLANAIDRTVRG
ncbi:DUF302 domain-containing protein [Ectobacillus funiculus]|uniref:DUF302 domain-containing protein n=1 Tax=Ectobacillus funiculus TaxID=137993 RepID=UPI00397E5542